MKELELTFVANCDKCGDNRFIQLMKQSIGNRGVALYRRQNMEGRTLGYEVFLYKVVTAGTPLPVGFVEEDYEPYPGASSFGKTAFSCMTEERAKERFEELVKKAKEAEANPTKGRGRRKKTTEPVKIEYPQGAFTVNMLASTNKQIHTVVVYKQVKADLKKGLITQVGTQKNRTGKGKSAALYSLAK